MEKILKELLNNFLFDLDTLSGMLKYSDMEHIENRTQKFNEVCEKLIDCYIKSTMCVINSEGKDNPYKNLVESEVFVEPFLRS